MKTPNPKSSKSLKKIADFCAYAAACTREETVVRGIAVSSERIVETDFYALDLRECLLQGCTFENCSFEKMNAVSERLANLCEFKVSWYT